MKEWKNVTCCPICGGKLLVSEHYTFSVDHTITRKGTLSKRTKKGVPGFMDCVTAFCLDCGHPFDGDDVTVECDDTVWIRVSEG